MNERVSLEVTPQRSRVDEDLSIRASGLPPGSRVGLQTVVHDGAQVPWRSRVTFLVGPEGEVDTARHTPLPGGSYRELYGHGPLWSVRSRTGRYFVKTKPTPLTYTFTLWQAGSRRRQTHPLATATIQRHFGDDVVHTPIHEGPVLGTLHHREGTPAPGVLLLGGSEGRLLDHAGSLLASHGYAVLTLAYFGQEDRPSDLMRVDLGDVDAAIALLADHPACDGRIGIIGASRGAELALQVAADNDRVGLVVASSPSALRQPGVSRDFTDHSQPAWVREGEVLGYNPGRLRLRDWAGMLGRAFTRRPLRQASSFRRALSDPAKVARAAIPVERAQGPLLLISGLEDQVWPSAQFATMIRRRLEADRWPGQVREVRLADVGHFAAFPYNIPTLPPITQVRAMRTFEIDFGGEVPAHARAAWSTWDQILDALADWSG